MMGMRLLSPAFQTAQMFQSTASIPEKLRQWNCTASRLACTQFAFPRRPQAGNPIHARFKCSTLMEAGACAIRDRKSTRLNSSHLVISYAVFCLKKKKKTTREEVMLQLYNKTTRT